MDKIVKKLLEKTQYNGDKEPSNTISASEFGSDLLQIYYRHKYGVPDNKEFNQATIGSLLHISVQELLKDEFKSEVHLSKEFPNKWKLSGSIDLLNDEYIIDIKVTKQYTVESVLNNKYHAYRWQLAVYKYLAKEILGKDLKTGILFFLKDGGYDFRNKKDLPSILFKELEVPSSKEVEERFYEIIEKLNLIDEDNFHCQDLWWRKDKTGVSEPLRCKKYCSYSDKCKWYQKFKENNLNVSF